MWFFVYRAKRPQDIARENLQQKRSNTGRTSAGTKLSTDNLLQDLPKWLEDFTEHLVDAEDSTSGSETVVGSEPRCPLPLPTGGSGKQNLFTHVPKDPICAVCKRATITRVPCRKRSNNHILHAEKFGDLITADHKITNEEGESCNNHRYAVTVQDFATQWIGSYSSKTKTSQETTRSLQKFLDANAGRKAN